MKIEKGTIKELIIQIIVYIAAAMIIWPLLDFIIDILIRKREFVYSINNHIIEPIIFGIIYGFIMWIIGKKKIEK